MNRNIEPSYEMASKILETMTLSKPMSLSELNNKTGFSFGAILQCCAILITSGILYRAQDGGKIFYILLKKDYHENLEEILPRTEKVKPKANDGKIVFSKTGEPIKHDKTGRRSETRTAIVRSKATHPKVKDRTNEKLKASKRPTSSSTPKASPSSTRSEATARVRSRSAVIERQSNQNSKEAQRKRSTSSSKTDRRSKSNELQRVSPQFSASLPNRDFPLSGSYKRVISSSSSSHKAIFINHPTRTGPGSSPSRSMYNAAPPVGFDPNALRRSDTNLPSKASITPRPKTPPLLSFRPNVQSQNELTESDLREKLGISEKELLLTITANRATHELCSAFSAVANSGGGYIILGIRKHSDSYFIKSITRAEDLIKSLIQNFKDQEIISDCPEDDDYIKVIEFGRKKTIAITIDPKKLLNRPVYTSVDAFETRNNNGCYIYRDGEVVRCTEEETKALWSRYIEPYKPDWTQEGQLPDIELKRKVKPVLPPIIDDAVRPLSRKTSTYGQIIPQTQYKSRKGRWKKPVLTTRSKRDTKTRTKTSSPRVPKPVTAGPQSTQLKLQNIATLPPNTSEYNDLVDDILMAEDIRPARKALNTSKTKTQNVKTKSKIESIASKARKSEEELEQVLDLEALIKIAEPARKHARMPLIRLAEIVEALTRHTALELTEIAELIQRKPPYIKSRVIAKLQENDDFILVKDRYQWKS